MDALRKPFFFAAMTLAVLIVMAEAGSALGLRTNKVNFADNANALTNAVAAVPGLSSHLGTIKDGALGELERRRPPGLGIPRMALLDGLMLFSMGLMGMQFLIGERLQGRIQGLATFIVSLLVLMGAIVLIVATLAKVILMAALFVTVPFGTIAYLVIWGSFKTGAAKAVLGLLMMMKLGLGACLVLAHQRFLQNKGLVLLIITSLVANLIVSFLHALVPRILVSITDGIAAIVVLVLAAIWAVIFLIGSVVSVKRALA